MNTPRTASPRSQIIDGFRGLAILAVLCFHYLYRWAPPRSAGDAYGYDAVHLWPAFGWSGVQLFFIISGLVICMTLLRARDALEFGIRRFARLYPAFVVAAGVITLVLAIHDPLGLKVGLRDYLLTLTLLSNNIGHWNLVDGAFWSLTVEVRFYAYAALFHALLGARFWWGLVALAAVGAMARLVHPGAANLLFIADWTAPFLIGVGIWFAVFRCEAWPAAVCAIAGLTAYGLHVPHADEPGGAALIASAFVLGGGGLMALLLWKAPHLPLGPLAWLGRISYSLYLYHQKLGVTVIHDLKRLGAPDLVAFLGATGVAVALGWLSFHLIEGPTQNAVLWLYGKLRRERRGTAPISLPQAVPIAWRDSANDPR